MPPRRNRTPIILTPGDLMPRGLCNTFQRCVRLAASLLLLAVVACVPGRELERPEGTAIRAVPSSTATATTPSLTPRVPVVSPTAFGTPAPITVTSPSAGTEIRSPVSVRGTASVFEANVLATVKNARGEVIGQGVTPASAGAPERGDYSASIGFTLTGGRQSGIVEVSSPSPRDGAPQHLVSVAVVLVP